MYGYARESSSPGKQNRGAETTPTNMASSTPTNAPAAPTANTPTTNTTKPTEAPSAKPAASAAAAGKDNRGYPERLHRLNLQSLELRRLLADLVWCYKVVFGMVDINTDDFLSCNSSVTTRGHKYKLFKKRTVSNVRATFFSERVINVWNFLPTEVDFTSLPRLKFTIQCVDFSGFLKCV